jgi:hypothetical protein
VLVDDSDIEMFSTSTQRLKHRYEVEEAQEERGKSVVQTPGTAVQRDAEIAEASKFSTIELPTSH